MTVSEPIYRLDRESAVFTAQFPTEPVPLSVPQRGIWLAQLLKPQVPMCIAQYLEFHGDLDIQLLRTASIQASLEFKSGYLRLVEINGEPYQVFDPSLDIPSPLIDLRAHPDPMTAAQQWMRREYTTPLDLLKDRLLTYAVLQIADEHFLWYTKMHHIALDGYAAMTTTNRIAELYSAAVQGREAEPIQPADLDALYLADCAYRESKRFETDRTYWVDKLADVEDGSSLSAVSAPSSLRADNAIASTELSASVVEQILRTANKLGATPAAVVLATFGCYLARMTGREQVLVNIPVSGRTTIALRRSAGMFVNVVPFPIDLRATDTVASVTQRVQSDLIGALRHQRFGLADIRTATGDINPQRFAGPTVNVMLFEQQIRFGSLTGDFKVLTTGPAEDLMLTVYRRGNRTAIDFLADPNRYSDSELADQHTRFVSFLDAFSTAPAPAPVTTLPLLTPAETELLAPAHGKPSQGISLLPRLLTAAADADADAVMDNGTTLTYRELDLRSTQLARILIEHGIGPETLVPLALSRSSHTIVAMWAVAKTGAAFVPVDPTQPAGRIDRMLTHVAARIGLTRTIHRPALPDSTQWLLLDHPDFAARTAAAATSPITDSDRITPLHPEHPAYLIYTSGSTGTPKAVVVTHTGLADLAEETRDRFGVVADARTLGAASPSFDVSVLEWLTATAAGATLVLAPPTVNAGAELAELISTQRITHATLTPTVLASMNPNGLDTLHTVILGGENLTSDLADRWAPGRNLINTYGATETTIMATAGTPTETAAANGSVPIGFPVRGFTAIVLDHRLQPVPPGVVGELYLSGSALARGYHNRLAVTATRFLPNPYGPAGSRMYRTGDLVSWNNDHSLKYISRSDRQLKVRGNRIEPGEIESTVREFAGVEQATVTVHSHNTHTETLVCYVVPTVGHAPDTAALIKYSADRLPAHMVPNAVVVLDRIPLTPSGKLDQKALPAPDYELRSVTDRQPETASELILAQLYAEVLGVDAVGVDESFFALGGDSIMSIQLAARAKTAGLTLSPRDVFTHRTVAELARVATTDDSTGSMPSISIDQHRIDRLEATYPGLQDVWPLSPEQQDLLSLSLYCTGAFDTNVLQLCLEFGGRLDIDRLQRAMAAVIERHPNLRAAFVSDGSGGFLQAIPQHAEVPFHHIDLREHRTTDSIPDTLLQDLMEIDRHIRFDLEQAPLLRLTLFTIAPERYRLLLTMHHILIDGWSTPLLVRELVTLYATDGDSTELPVVPPYRDYLAWLEHQDDNAAEIAWQQALAGKDEPTLVAGPNYNRHNADVSQVLVVELDEHRTSALSTTARRNESTLNTLVQVAWALTLAQQTAQEDVVFGTIVSGRPAHMPGIEAMIGLLINTVPVRVRLDWHETPGTLLRRIHLEQSTLLDHQHLGLDRIQQLTGPSAVLDTLLLFQSFPIDRSELSAAVDIDGLRILDVHGLDSSTYPLCLAVFHDSGLRLVLKYQSSLFTQQQAAAVLARVEQTLDVLASEPNTPLSELTRIQ